MLTKAKSCPTVSAEDAKSFWLAIYERVLNDRGKRGGLSYRDVDAASDYANKALYSLMRGHND